MAMRSVCMRLGCKRLPFSRAGGVQTRSFSSEGRVLSEEERAQENLYIKKMERERLEKARQAMKHEEPAASTPDSSGPTSASESSSTRNVALFAGVAAVLAIAYWLVRPKAKEEQKN